jgi:hypothetical protein
MTFLQNARYPTDQEYTAIMDAFPEVRRLNLKLNTWDFQDSQNVIDAFIKPNDLSNWNVRLNNKLAKLKFSYGLLVFYGNDLGDENWQTTTDDGYTHFFSDLDKHGHYQKFMFDYFTEAFYYHYFSVHDIVAHLINIFFDIQITEGPSFAAKVYKKLKDPQLKGARDKFFEDTKLFRNRRNTFTHDFPINEIDSRSKKVNNEIHLGVYQYTTSKETIDEIHLMIPCMLTFLKAVEDRLAS